MFKKLKEKITEEVKISPQRFVEFTQSVSDRLQSNSTSDDNFFSIGDDDANTSVDSNSYGFSNVQLASEERNRKNSTSSLASDVSFLPRYEPGSMYHLQSDLDVSASEVEDNVSTSSSQLGHLSKEQIHSAFQKSQMRYHKYRGRYTDLTRHYKDLEREILKMKTVLVETQDKAIRRVTELKEQCNLEQKAKAHLEGALRDEIDEKNYKIKTLQTQITLLQNDHTPNNLVNIEDNSTSENLESLTKSLNESRKEIENLNAKIQELKANSIVFQSKEREYKLKIFNLEKEIVQFSEREKENNLNLAQNKMELHNEILLKDLEISNLKRDNETIKQKSELLENDSKTQKMENLQSQNTKLIEKVESLTQKSNNLESELIKMQTYKIELDNVKHKQDELEKIQNLNDELSKSLESEKENHEIQISQLREDAKKGLLSLEPKIRQKLELEFSQKEEEIKNEFTNKLEEFASNNNTTKEIQLQLFEKENLIKKITEQLDETNSELVKKIVIYTDLEKNHLELIEDCTKLRDTISNLEKNQSSLDSYEEKVARLEAHINTLQQELVSVKETLAKSCEKVKILEEQNLQLKSEDDSNKLIIKHKEHDNKSLVKTVTYLNENILELKQNLNIEKEEKNNLVIQLEDFQEKVRLHEMKQNAMNVEKNETGLLELKLKELEVQLKANVESVEKEHESISKDLDSVRNELNLTEEENLIHQFTQGGLKLKLDTLKDMCTKKDKEYNDLHLKLSRLEQENSSKSYQIQTLQEEIYNIQGLNVDYEKKIQNMEISINETQITLEEKEAIIKNLNDNIKENKNKLQQLEEQYILHKLKQEGLQLEISEYHMLQLKSQKLEEEHQKLQQQFDKKKLSFEDSIEKFQNSIKKLEKDNAEACEKYESEKLHSDSYKEKLQKLEDDLKTIQSDKDIELEEYIAANENLKTENEEKVKEIFKLSSSINNLDNDVQKQSEQFNKLLTKTEELQSLIENNKIEKLTAVKEEREKQDHLNLKIEELNQVLQQKSDEINGLKQTISELEKESGDLKSKDKEIYILNAERDSLVEEITTLRGEIEELTNEISQTRNTNSKLLYSETEKEDLKFEKIKIKGEISELNKRIQQLSLDNRNIMEENQILSQEKEELKIALDILNEDQTKGPDIEKLKIDNLTLSNTVADLTIRINELQENDSKLKNESDIIKIRQDFYEIKEKCDELFTENKNLKLEYSSLEEKCNSFGKIKEKLETQISDLERHYNDLLREKQLLADEVQELKTDPVNYKNDISRLDTLETLKQEQSFLKDSEKTHYIRELELLNDKLMKYKSLDLTNKSSIEFYENELQKMKNQNDKLNRKLDETIVTLNHCAELSTSTEVEYLKNVLYNYMLGKESLVLARVIAAVCKFDPQQTETILQKEQQKQTLLGHLGLI